MTHVRFVILLALMLTLPAQAQMAHVDGAGGQAWQAMVASRGLSVEQLLAGADIVEPDAQAMLIVPHEAVRGEIHEDIDELLAAGGIVVIIATNASANRLLGPLGASTTEIQILDPTGTGLRLPEGDTLRWSDAQGLALDKAWQPFAISGPEARLDLDGDGAVGRAEPVGPHAAAAFLEVGSGRLYAIASVAWLSDTPDAQEFLDALQQEHPDLERVIIDKSATSLTPRETVAGSTLIILERLRSLAPDWLAWAVIAVAIAASLRSQPREPASSTRDPIYDLPGDKP
ncbi:MAG: hypothetical protein ACPHID_02435 [Thermoplasmatota archaeon]